VKPPSDVTVLSEPELSESEPPSDEPELLEALDTTARLARLAATADCALDAVWGEVVLLAVTTAVAVVVIVDDAATLAGGDILLLSTGDAFTAETVAAANFGVVGPSFGRALLTELRRGGVPSPRSTALLLGEFEEDDLVGVALSGINSGILFDGGESLSLLPSVPIGD
jgi:hypothetical protein